jgi:hypothetical protein
MKVFLWTICAFTALIFIGALSTTHTPAGSTGYTYTSSASTYSAPPDPTHGATLEMGDWSIGGFGVVAIHTFKVTAASANGVSDMTVRCRYFGGSGTELGQQTHTLYERVPAGRTVRFPGVNVGFVPQGTKSAACTLIAARLDYTAAPPPPAEKKGSKAKKGEKRA